jgi:hypothetical protein
MKVPLSMLDATEKIIEAISKCPSLYDLKASDIKDRLLQTIDDTLNLLI